MADQVHNHVGTPAASTEVRFVAVERDVAGLKTDIGEIKSTMNVGFEKLSSAIAGKGTNWTVVGLVLGAVFTVSGWGFALFGNFQSRTNDDIVGLKQMISAGIAEQKASVVAMQADTKATIATLAATQKAGDDALQKEVKDLASNFVGRADLNDKFQTAKEKRDSAQATTDQRIGRVEADLLDAKKDIVPLETHRGQWDHQRYVNDSLQKQVDELRSKSDSLFNGRDEIQRLVHRLDKLDDNVRDPRK